MYNNYEILDFAKRHVSWIFIAISCIFAFFAINNKLAKIQSTLPAIDRVVSENIHSHTNEEQTQQLMTESETRKLEVNRTSIFATALKSIIAGACALMIMSFTAFAFTKIDFAQEKSNQVLAYIALGAFILVGLIFAFEPAKAQRPSDISINCIKSFEGFRAKPYKDAVGVWTDGYGNTRNVIQNRLKSREEATIDLSNHLLKFDKDLKSRITRRLDQHEYDALICFIYNLGGGVIKGQLQSDINYGLADLVAYRMNLYVKAGGKTLNGLVRRRDVESKIYLCNCQYIRKYSPYYARCV